MKNKIRSKERLTQFKNDIMDNIKISNIIKENYLIEFENLFEKILIVSEEQFIKLLNQNSLKSLSLIYTDEILNNLNFMNVCSQNEKAVMKKYYNYNLKSLENAWNEYSINLQAVQKYKLSSKNKDNLPYLNTFINHCCNNKNAIHSCGERLIEVHNSNNNTTHVICIGCKYSYFSSCIKLFCIHCNVNFYTKYLSKLDLDNELVIATWEKYHCNNIINTHMRCIKCNDTFYLSRKSNLLKCLSCKFEIKPSNIAWQCLFCKDEFKSNAKQYDSIEFKIIRDSINETILKQNRAFPQYNQCCLEKKDYFHKKECSGEIFLGELFGKKIVVCEKCKAMNFYDKFQWTCPVCLKRFKNKSFLSNTNTKEDNSKNNAITETHKNNIVFQNSFIENRLESEPSFSPSKKKLNILTNNDLILQTSPTPTIKNVKNKNISNQDNFDDKKNQNFKPITLKEIIEKRKNKNYKSISINYADENVVSSNEENNNKILERRVSKINFLDKEIEAQRKMITPKKENLNSLTNNEEINKKKEKKFICEVEEESRSPDRKIKIKEDVSTFIIFYI